MTDERERAIWREHLAADDPVPLGSSVSASACPSSAWVRSPTSWKRRFREEIVEKLGSEIKTDWLGAEE